MKHTKSNNSAIWMILGVIAFVAIAYLISPEGSSVFAGGYKINRTTTNSISAPQGGGGGGCSMMRNNNRTTTTTPTTVTADPNITYETVQLSYDGSYLVPETTNLTAGKNYKLIITPSSDGLGCKTSLTIPGIDDNVYPIKKNVPITIVINNAQAKSYNVVCGAMGMYLGSIIVK